MTQTAVDMAHHEHSSQSKPKKRTVHSSGRGGSGNIRRQIASSSVERPPDLPMPPPSERQSASSANKKQFTSSGRGGSGNVQRPTSSLEAHPLTASILSHHSVVLAQHEQRVRKAHAELNVVRSSGRGGSGNISDPRRRSRSQEPRAASKRSFFTAKGRERGATRGDGVMQAQDRDDTIDIDGRSDVRTTRTRYSSSCSSALYTTRSDESRISHAMTSRSDVTTDSFPSEDAISAHSRKKPSFLSRWSRQKVPMSSGVAPIPPLSSTPTVSMYPQSFHGGDSDSSLRICSTSSVVFEEPEYVSFLEM